MMEKKTIIKLGHRLSHNVKSEPGYIIHTKKYQTWKEEFIIPPSGETKKKVECPACKEILEVDIKSEQRIDKSRLQGCYLFGFLSIMAFLSTIFIGWTGIFLGVAIIFSLGILIKELKDGEYKPTTYIWFPPDGTHKKIR